MLNKKILLCLAASGACAGCETGAETQRLPLSAPRTCALVRGAYCIESVGLTIEAEPRREGDSRLTIFEEHWREAPLIILEPAGCRNHLSDTIELISLNRAGGVLAMRIRLRKDATCDVDLTAADRERDSAGDGFFTAMTQIRSCAAHPCTGPLIGERIRSRIDWGPL